MTGRFICLSSASNSERGLCFLLLFRGFFDLREKVSLENSNLIEEIGTNVFIYELTLTLSRFVFLV